jgi:UDP-glucose 4-epimerase
MPRDWDRIEPWRCQCLQPGFYEGATVRVADRALVTGGAGMIGSAIVDLLVSQGVDVVVLDDFSRGRRANLDPAVASGRVTVVEGDIRNRDLVAKVMDGVDLVFHEAAIRITRCAAEPRQALEVLVDGTFNIVEAAVISGVRRLVAASSASVYGQASKFPTPEDHHPYANRTLYGAAKTFNEALLRSFAETHGLDYVALRYFNVYGPRMDTTGPYTEVVVRWMERIAAGAPPVILGDGSQSVDFIYVDDVARANLIAARSNASDDVFNIATGVATRLDDLATALIHAMGACHLEPEHADKPVANPVRHRQGDPSRAREALGFEAEIELAEGLRRLVAWWRTQR